MKCIILLFTRTFLKDHPRFGARTMFTFNIKGRTKIHTLRSNYAYWQPLIQQVQEGKAYLSLRHWRGRPYKSEQYEFARLTAKDGVGIERLVDYPGHAQISSHEDPNYRHFVYPEQLAENDGLTVQDFNDWFPQWGEAPGERALIHLTPFRYMEGSVTHKKNYGSII